MTREGLQFVPGLAVWVRTELSRDDDEGELGVMNAEVNRSRSTMH